MSMLDMLTAVKNVVIAINSAARTMLGVQGLQSAVGISTATQVYKGQGRVASVAVVTAPSAGTSYLYDAATTAGLTTALALCALPSSAGVYVINMPFSSGLVAAPGSGGVLALSYSTGAAAGTQ